MAQFTQPVLIWINRIFGILGGRVTVDEIDLVAPIQLVLDIRRQSELSRIVTDPSAAGYFSFSVEAVHGAGGTIDVEGFPYASLQATWGVVDQRWIWLMQASMSATVAASLANISAVIPVIGNAFAARQYLLRHWQMAIAVAAGSAPANHGFMGVNDRNSTVAPFAPDASDMCQFPFPLPPGSTVNLHTVASAASTIRVQMLCWVGPIGVYPPGMA